MMHIRHKEGFTLIELLVVIAIIGILASVVLASLNSARAKSRDATRMAQLKEVQKARQLYYTDNGSYPSVSNPYRLSGISSALVPTYISTLPLDPVYGESDTGYRYLYGANYDSYTLLAYMEGTAGWCSMSLGVGYATWNGDPSDGGGTNYPPC